jgi:hypothetical protein
MSIEQGNILATISGGLNPHTAYAIDSTALAILTSLNFTGISLKTSEVGLDRITGLAGCIVV